ncbi:MAG: hypothetical protein U1E76_19310 [Planctomycetota bacterium]
MKPVLLATLVAVLLPAPAAKPPYRVVLKTGRVIEADIAEEKNGVFELRDAAGDERTLARAHVRAIEGDGRFADPEILWRRVPGAGAAPPPSFVRSNVTDGGGSLDIGVAGYEQADTGRRVYLAGAVHVGHAEYYAALQSILDAMDLVLWEGVGAKEKPSAEAIERFDVLFRSQVMLRNMLNLDGQLECIDYHRSFWRNCDVSINELEAELNERGLEMIPNEGLFRLLFGTLFTFIEPESIPRNELIGRSYRRMVGPMMAAMSDPDSVFDKLGAKGMKDVIIDFRNDHVMQSLKQLLREPGPARIAIFYGAGHLPGMDVVLRQELKMRYLGMHWLAAWRY